MSPDSSSVPHRMVLRSVTPWNTLDFDNNRLVSLSSLKGQSFSGEVFFSLCCWLISLCETLLEMNRV